VDVGAYQGVGEPACHGSVFDELPSKNAAEGLILGVAFQVARMTGANMGLAFRRFHGTGDDEEPRVASEDSLNGTRRCVSLRHAPPLTFGEDVRTVSTWKVGDDLATRARSTLEQHGRPPIPSP